MATGGSTVAWARALVAGALPSAVAFAWPHGTLRAWLVLACALALVTISAWLTRPRGGAPGSAGAWWLGLALCAVAVLAGARARAVSDAAFGRDRWPSYDLASTPVPAQPPEYIAVTGVLRDAWVLGEYDVAPGGLPDQSRGADVVLIPMAANLDAAVALEGALVVARVRADAPRTREPVTLFGHTEPLAPELAATMVDLAGASAHDVPGVLLDTLRVPQPRDGYTALGLWIGLCLASGVALAWGRRAGG